MTASQVKSNEPHLKVSAKELARKWNVGLETARETMNASTLRGVWTSMEPLSRRVGAYPLDIHRKRLKGNWYADTSISKFKSILGNTVDNVYTQGKFVNVYHIKKQMELGKSLIDFTDNVRVTDMLPTSKLTSSIG